MKSKRCIAWLHLWHEIGLRVRRIKQIFVMGHIFWLLNCKNQRHVVLIRSINLFFEHSGLKSYSISRNAKLDVRQFRSHEDWLFGAVDTAPKIEDDFFSSEQSRQQSIAVVQSVA